MSGRSVLVVAGESSGDRMASLILGEMRRQYGAIETWGIGGPLSGEAGLARVFDGRSISLMGIGDPLRAAAEIQRALLSLAGQVRRRGHTTIALLINFTEFNTHLGRLLKGLGTRVLWVAAPQVWAWRPGRLHTIGRSIDRMGVLFPFEEPLFRSAGIDARFIGHPALEIPVEPREALRTRLGLPREAILAALLPGSRAGEISRLAEPFARAADQLRRSGDIHGAYFIETPFLRSELQNQLHQIAKQFNIQTRGGESVHGAAPLLPAFDLALCASGTVTLEAALAGVPQVAAYRTDALSAWMARLLLKTPFVSLPNILMGEPRIAELLQDDAQSDKIADEGRRALQSAEKAALLGQSLRMLLQPGFTRGFGARALDLMRDWLG